MEITKELVAQAVANNPTMGQAELIRNMGWEPTPTLRVWVSRAYGKLDKNSPKVEEVVTPDVKEPVIVEPVTPSESGLTTKQKEAIRIIEGATKAAFATVEAMPKYRTPPEFVTPEPRMPEPLQPAPAKPSGFAKFVTISLIVIGCIVSGITSFHFTLFSEMGMPLAFSVILSLALEAGFWACLIQVTHKDSDHYYTFAVMSWSLILYRLLANTSGIYTHALAADPVLFGHHIKSGGMWWYAIGLSALLTLCDVAIAKITVERITHKVDQP